MYKIYNHQSIHDQLRNYQVLLIFEFKVIVDELIELIDELKVYDT